MQVQWKKAVSTRYQELVEDLEVSNTGNVRKMGTGKIFKQYSHNGYPAIQRAHKNIKVHILVAETFIRKRRSEEEDEVVDHIDGNCFNNNLSNLRFIPTRENSLKGNADHTTTTTKAPDAEYTLLARISQLERALTTIHNHQQVSWNIYCQDQTRFWKWVNSLVQIEQKEIHQTTEER